MPRPIDMKNRNDRRRRRFEFDRERRIPDSVLELLTNTRRLYRVWWFTHYAVGLSGVVAGAMLTAITSSSMDGKIAKLYLFGVNLAEYSWLIGIVAAVTTSLVTFLGPLHKAERYWSAFHNLELACLEYAAIEHNTKWDRLMRRVTAVHGILQVVDLDERLRSEIENLRGAKAADLPDT